MNEYLFNLSGDCPPSDTPAAFLADQVFFAWWKTRQAPYDEITEGDRLWWVDKNTREVRWELSAVEILKRPYSSHREASEMLRRAYGVVLDDVDDYSDWSSSGWLLAVAVDVMTPVEGVQLPASVRLGRNGYRAIDTDLRNELEQAGLPTPSRTVAARHPSFYNANAIARVFTPPPSRSIPVHVKNEVLSRDRGRCQQKGCNVSGADLHFDHIRPWSKGGDNDPSNIQLLCSKHNMAKGATMPDDVRVELYEEPVKQLCLQLETRVPSNEQQLVDVISRGVAGGHVALAEEVVQALARDYSETGRHLEVALDALEAAEGPTDLTRFYRAWVDDPSMDSIGDYVSSADERVAHEAAIWARLDGDNSAETTRVLADAKDSEDPWIGAGARFALAGSAERYSDEELELIEELVDSPAMLWRTLACKELAFEYCDRGFESTEEIRRFYNLVDAAIACPLRQSAEEAMLLLATFLADSVPEHKSRTATFYANVLTASEDPELRAAGEELRDELEGRAESI